MAEIQTDAERKMDNRQMNNRQMNNRWIAGTVAVLAGMALNFFGDWLTGGHIEDFRGIDTFNLSWAADVFLVPFMVGLLVAKIFGKHAKWLACLPPLFVRSLTYVYLYLDNYYGNPNADFYLNLHLHYWGLCVILAVESANLAAIMGEVMVKVYHRKEENGKQQTIVRAGQTEEIIP